MIALFIGPSGSGKDTQADMLAEDYGFLVASTGNLIREEIAKDTELGKKLKINYEKGLFNDDKDVYALVRKFVEDNPGKDIILTGAIRRVSQIEILDEVLKEDGMKLDLVLYFELSDEAAVERMSGRVIDPETGEIYHVKHNPPPAGIKCEVRDDDKPEAIKMRLKEFQKYYQPILSAYEERDIMHTVDASLSIKDIYSEIKSTLQLN